MTCFPQKRNNAVSCATSGLHCSYSNTSNRALGAVTSLPSKLNHSTCMVCWVDALCTTSRTRTGSATLRRFTCDGSLVRSKCCRKERARTLEQDAYVTCRSCTSPPTRSVTGSSSCGPRCLYKGYACPAGGPAWLWSQTGSVRRSGRHAQRSAVDSFKFDLLSYSA